ILKIKNIIYNNTLCRINFAFLKICFVCILVCLVKIFFSYDTNVLLKEYRSFNEEKNIFKKIRDERIIQKFQNIQPIFLDNKKSETYVIVIGESVDRKHLGIYNYYRQTTPFLSKTNNIYTFDNIVSPNAQTLDSLTKALTFYDDINFFQSKRSIINFFNDAGFKTFWISNQNFSGWGKACLISLMAQDALKYVFINRFSWESLKAPYDEKLLPYFKKAINDPYKKKIIFIHLMGSHDPYADRYPEKFNVFKKNNNWRAQTVSEYDNSILYTDYVLKQIIGLLSERKEFSYMLYFSDHGEDVYEDQKSTFAHADFIGTRHMYEIPFILWLSDSYKKNRPGMVKDIEKFKNRPYNIQHLTNTITELSNLGSPDIDKTKSLFYEIKPSTVSKTVSEIRNNIWLYRVNNKQRLLYYFDKYEGFEIDVNFNENKDYFNVSHENIEGNINLDDMFWNIANLKSKYFILDFQNLSHGNKEKALYELERITAKYNLKRNHIIVESHEIEPLNFFGKKGFYTSFRLSDYSYEKSQEYKNYVRSIEEDINKLSKSNVSFVSSDAKFFMYVNFYFPSISHLFYALDKNHRELTEYILETDKNTAAVLIPDIQKFYE
ncbi:MAG: phosphoethanolamine transferase, partial [Endomicrobiaceae bacterium]